MHHSAAFPWWALSAKLSAPPHPQAFQVQPDAVACDLRMLGMLHSHTIATPQLSAGRSEPQVPQAVCGVRAGGGGGGPAAAVRGGQDRPDRH